MERGPRHASYQFGVFEARIPEGELKRNGERVRLQEQPFQVLIALLERPAEIVTREEIRQRLWPSDTFVDFDHGLNTAINKLREALGDTASNPRFIETLPRRGYRFIAPVKTVGEKVAPEKAIRDDQPSVAEKRSPTAPLESELPQAHPLVSRTLFGLLQLMYLIFYSLTLAKLEEVSLRVSARLGLPALVMYVVLVTGIVGIAVRLYTLFATLFGYAHLGSNFQRIFPLVLLLDLLWALSPFLIEYKIGIGLAFAACAALVYSPFAQRVLALMAFPPTHVKS